MALTLALDLAKLGVSTCYPDKISVPEIFLFYMAGVADSLVSSTLSGVQMVDQGFNSCVYRNIHTPQQLNLKQN